MSAGYMEPSSQRSVTNCVFTAVIVLYVVHSSLFIARTSYVIDGQRYFTLFDDAMISMCYARNLARGDGLVWNPGDVPIEGYTNFLWVLYLSLIHHFPFPPEKISLCVQLSGLLFFASSLRLLSNAAGMVSASVGTFVPVCSVILSAGYLPLSNWCLQGMETSALILVICAAVYMSLANLNRDSFSIWVYLLLGVSTLIRIDMAVVMIALCLSMASIDRAHRARHLVFGLTCLGIFLTMQTIGRLWYYGQPFPNTYYLKMTGYPVHLRVIRGLLVFLKFVLDTNPFLFVAPVWIMRDCPRTLRLMLWISAAQFAYSIYVGGDAWEWWGGANRYCAVVMPLYFVVLSWSLYTVISRALQEGGATYRSGFLVLLFLWPLVRLLNELLLFNATETVSFMVNLSMLSAALLLVHIFRSYWQKTRTMRDANAGNLPWGYASLAISAFLLVNLNLHRGIESLQQWMLVRPPLMVTQNGRHARIAVLIRSITDRKAVVAVGAAGTIAYLVDRSTIDLLGKNDAHIAHEASKIESIWQFNPGHNKWDYAYSIGQLRPDVVAQLVDWAPRQQADQYLKEYRKLTINGLSLFLRRGSEHVLWNRLRSLPVEMSVTDASTVIQQ